jgi:uncharacterized membrane protein (UPF0127 family)
MQIISQSSSKLIKNVVFSFGLLLSMSNFSEAKVEQNKERMINSLGKSITLRLSVTRDEHTKGLSGLKPGEFGEHEGMLFVNKDVAPRQFWMPDTYFNLDIIFLGPELQVIGIEKNVPAHPGMKEPPAIFRTGIYQAQHVLETKAGSPFSSALKVGEKLKWTSSLAETKSKTHPAR